MFERASECGGDVLDLKKHSPCVNTKALCLRRGNDTLVEQKKLNTILASAACRSYDTGKKKRERRVWQLHRYRVESILCRFEVDLELNG